MWKKKTDFLDLFGLITSFRFAMSTSCDVTMSHMWLEIYVILYPGRVQDQAAIVTYQRSRQIFFKLFHLFTRYFTRFGHFAFFCGFISLVSAVSFRCLGF